MRIKLFICLLLFASILASADRPASLSSPCAYSSLWGVSGEKWYPGGRLPDFSYAGYHAGEARIPNARARWNLKRDFHAKGDGRTDDSAALRSAIQSIKSGVLFIPEGTYVIAQRIDITKGNLVLRGAGRGKTILQYRLSSSIGKDV